MAAFDKSMESKGIRAKVLALVRGTQNMAALDKSMEIKGDVGKVLDTSGGVRENTYGPCSNAEANLMPVCLSHSHNATAYN
jgi:hypothetical protein